MNPVPSDEEALGGERFRGICRVRVAALAVSPVLPVLPVSPVSFRLQRGLALEMLRCSSLEHASYPCHPRYPRCIPARFLVALLSACPTFCLSPVPTAPPAFRIIVDPWTRGPVDPSTRGLVDWGGSLGTGGPILLTSLHGTCQP